MKKLLYLLFALIAISSCREETLDVVPEKTDIQQSANLKTRQFSFSELKNFTHQTVTKFNEDFGGVTGSYLSQSSSDVNSDAFISRWGEADYEKTISLTTISGEYLTLVPLKKENQDFIVDILVTWNDTEFHSRVVNKDRALTSLTFNNTPIERSLIQFFDYYTSMYVNPDVAINVAPSEQCYEIVSCFGCTECIICLNEIDCPDVAHGIIEDDVPMEDPDGAGGGAPSNNPPSGDDSPSSPSGGGGTVDNHPPETTDPNCRVDCDNCMVAPDNPDCPDDELCYSESYILEFASTHNLSHWSDWLNNPQHIESGISCEIVDFVESYEGTEDLSYAEDAADIFIHYFDAQQANGGPQLSFQFFAGPFLPWKSIIIQSAFNLTGRSNYNQVDSGIWWGIGKSEYNYLEQYSETVRGLKSLKKTLKESWNQITDLKELIQNQINQLNIQVPQTTEEWEALGGLILSVIAQEIPYLIPYYGDVLTLMDEFKAIHETGRVTTMNAINIGASVLSLFPVTKVVSVVGAVGGVVVTGVKCYKYVRPVLRLGNALLRLKGKVRLNGSAVKFLTESGDELLQVKNAKILPTKYDYPINTSATNVDEVYNGYQVVKHGDNLSVRRVPDVSGYSQSELDLLYDHPNSHVLERHGHDVTDEALIKRSGTPSVAPDGQVANNPPQYSSKFQNANRLKEALNKTMPGNPNWNPPSSSSTYAFDYPQTGVADIPFGYGIPAGGGAQQSMNRVKVVYKKVSGEWKLLTMYPQL